MSTCQSCMVMCKLARNRKTSVLKHMKLVS